MYKKLYLLTSFVLVVGLVGSASGASGVVFIQNVTSASNSAQGAIYTINGSGMTGDLHDSSYFTLWMTRDAAGVNGGGYNNPHPGTYNPGPGAWTWIKFEFDGVYPLDELWVWNYNEWTARGLKNVVIEYTSDGTTWETLGSSHLFARAPTAPNGHGYDDYAHNTTIDFNGVDANAVIITTEEGVNIGNWGSTYPLFGLSEVRFYYIPDSPYASNPDPPDDANDVVSTKVLRWELGAYAADVNGHDVYLGTDYNDVNDANHLSEEFIGRQTATSYNPGGLELGQEYFWRIDEVNEQSSVLTGEVWDFTVNVEDPELALKLNRGLTLDRQFHSIPGPGDPMSILSIDIQIIKSMGFEFVKLIVNPALFKSGSTIYSPNMWYLDDIVNVVLDEGLPAVVCIHPETSFKVNVLSNWGEFEDMLGFYEDFAAYMTARWEPNELAFQLMTEPHGNAWSWNVMQPLMWEAARNGMPDHTLILSGDQGASIEGLLAVVPVDDRNVIYCFEGYEPFIFTFSGGVWVPANNYIRYLQHVPWPSNPTVISNRMSDMIANVPPSYQADAQAGLTAYGNAYWSKDNLFNYRLQMALDWAEENDGQKLIVGEWGVYHGTVYLDERNQYIRDARELFEENGIGWAYWSYNETQTVLDPSVRVALSKTPSYDWIYEEILNVLGLLCGEGDINCDNTVDYEDLVILLDQWLQPPDTPPYADVAPLPDGDGIADFLDFSAVGKHWMEDVTPY